MNSPYCPDCGSEFACNCANKERRSDPTSDHMDLLDAAALLKRWTRKHPDTDLGLKTLDWLKRRNFRSSILRNS